jgi:hypothetical protein
MSGKIVEISLKSLTWGENGEIDEKRVGNNILTFDLIYPAPGKADITTIKKLKLKDNGSINFENGKHTFSDRIVFKEEIYGESALVVHLTDVQTRSGISKFITAVLKGFYKTIWGIFTGSIDNVVIGLPLNEITTRIDDLKESPEEKIYIIGKALKEINEKNLKDETWEMDLEVPKNVYRKDYTHPDYRKIGARGEIETKPILKEGDNNGKLVLNVKVL